jgi:hypothetical protein
MEDKENTKNLILDNWEFIDSFLGEFVEKQKQEDQKNSMFKVFSSLFRVKENHPNITSLNIVREKLWLYYYKERFKKKTVKHSPDSQKLYS